MITLTIILGITALLGAYAAGLTQTWVGTSATSAIVLLLAIAALPDCHWLLQSAGGWLATALLWAMLTTFYHRLLADARRQAPMIVGRRSGFVWSMGRYTVGVAVGVTA